MEQQTNEASHVQAQPEVVGFLSENWGDFDRPALVANPDARAGDVVAWCWGEIKAVLASTNAVIAANEDLGIDDVGSIYLHRLKPVEQMLDHAMSLIRAEQEPMQAQPPRPRDGLRAA